MYPEIKTPRLLLRRWTRQDVVPFSVINGDPRVMEFMPRTLSLPESKTWIDTLEAHFDKYGFGLWAVEQIETRRMIGFTGLQVPKFTASFTPCVEIGWRFAYDAWGQGFATEAARAALFFGFDKLGLPEILSFTVPANVRSWHVMERIGMQRDKEGDFRHPVLPLDHKLSYHYLYRTTCEKWLQQHQLLNQNKPQS